MLRTEPDPAPSPPSRWFKSTEWLAEHLHDRDVAVVDASYPTVTQKRDVLAEHRSGHIPGAVFFDIDAIADTSTGLPHMLPDEMKFAAEMAALGLGDGMRFVVYDAHGLFAVARVWWMLRAFGADDVTILDGGLPKWIREGRPLEQGEARPPFRRFTPRLNHGFVASIDDVRKALASGATKRYQKVRKGSATR